MSAQQRLSDLDARKRLVLARAELHRGVFTFERERLHRRWDNAHDFVARHRWWLIGGAIAAGGLLARGSRGFAGTALTAILSVVRGYLR